MTAPNGSTGHFSRCTPTTAGWAMVGSAAPPTSRRARNPEVRGDGHLPGALNEIPKPVIVALLRAGRVGMRMIFGRSLTPLNSSKTFGVVHRRDDHSRRNV